MIHSIQEVNSYNLEIGMIALMQVRDPNGMKSYKISFCYQAASPCEYIGSDDEQYDKKVRKQTD